MPRTRRSLFRNAIFGTATSLRVTVLLERGLSGPPLPLRIEVLDPCFVLKCKVECALRLLRETQGEGAIGTVASAEDIVLEFRGIPLRDMTTLERYGLESGAEITASYAPQPAERDTVPREPTYLHLDAQIMSQPGVPSTGTIKRIVAEHGKLCQVCWRGRWFRAEVLNVYSTSVLLSWLDWNDAEWPNFFVRVALAAAPGAEPESADETWRIRWHVNTPTKQLPVVQPRYRELPPLNWVKAFLRTYAASDEPTMLREIQATLPRELVEAQQIAAARHRCIVIGASSVGKSTLVATFYGGPPPPAAPSLSVDGISAAADDAAEAAVPGRRRRHSTHWPTVGTRCSHGTVNTPGIAPLQLEIWDTSGNPRFKPLSLVFYRQAQSVILVFDVKSMESFRALGAVGGWMHEFTRLTGHSPRNFPFVLVGNKAEDDLMHHRQVYEEDVREWLYKDGGRMPYIETSFGGDPRAAWRNAEHVFRTVARTAHRLRENFGRFHPPETVRVAAETEYSDEVTADASFLDARSIEKSFVQRFGSSHGRPSISDQIAGHVREPLDKAKELLLCGKRSLEKLGAKRATTREEHRFALQNKTSNAANNTTMVVRG